MAIKNKFIHFKTRAAFDVNVPNPTATADDGNQFYNYTTFIQDTKEIYTHGTFYKCDISEEEVEALIASKGYITEDDIPVLSGGAAATSGQYVSGVTVSGHTVTVTKATLPSNAKTATKLATPRVIAIAGAVSGSATFDGSSNVSINSTLANIDASKITSGTLNADRLPEIPISKIPAAAMERLYVVESQSAAMSLTIQEGDVVQIGSGGPMYFCVSESASTFATKFKVFTAGAATSVPWSGVTNAPTKLSQFTNDSGFTTNKGTVTSVAMSVPTGLSISGSPITASGTLALSYTSGFSIPSTAKQTNWDTAYEWGDHASAGYVKNSVNENITGIKNFMNGLKVFTNSATTSNEYNTTGKINITNYAAPIIFGSNSSKVWWSTQFQSSTTLLIGRANSIPIRIQSLNSSEGNASEIYATRFYQNEKLVATEEWVTGKGYLTSVPAQTWGSITGKPTFATVATSGSYNDLTNKPTIPSAYTLPTASTTVLGGVKIGSGISISSGVISATYSSVGAAAASHTHTASQVTGLATVATSGSYNDLTNKPTIPSLSGYATQSWVTSRGYLTSIPAATSSAYGGIQIGYTTSGKNYAVQLSNGKAYVNVPWTDTNTNYYPTSFAWKNGTTAGPTGSLTGSEMSAVSFGAIPSASATQSGVVTTGDQTFGGIKTIDTINVTNINEATPGRGFWIGYNTEGTIHIGKDGDYDFGTSGGTYSGTANTAKRLLNSLQFSNGQSFNGSSAVTIDLPEIPVALPNPYALTINGTSYTGSSAVSVTTPKILSTTTLNSSTVSAGYSYNNTASKTILSLSGFSASNPDSVIISTAKLTFTASNAIKMDGLADLSGTYYIYCLSYMANGKIAVNGAVYA